EMSRRLRAVGATVGRTHGETIEVVPPPHRLDLRQAADLAEEIARIGGYDAIPTVRPRIAARGRPSAAEGVRRLQEGFAAHGFAEAVVLAFSEPRDNELFPGPWEPGVGTLELVNPLATVARELRRGLLPGLLGALAVNQARGESFVPLFTVGTVFARDGGGRALEKTALAALVWGIPPAPVGRAAEPLRFGDVKHIVESVLAGAGVGAPRWSAERGLPWLHPGQAAELRGRAGRLGWLGAAHPGIVQALDLRPGELWLLELDVPGVLASRRPTPRYVEPPRFPSVARDVALVVEAGVEAGAIRDALVEMRDPLVENVELFDEYTGAGVPPGRKSLAYSISYRAPDRTLTDQEVNAAHEELLRRLAARFSFERRGVASEVET